MKAIIITFILTTNLLAFKYTIQGNSKTNSSVISSEISDLVNHPLNKLTINEIERRLWNLRLFSKVELKKKGLTLYITVDERWTLIPIAKLLSGGGSTYYALGAYDINVLGKNIELGGQYENLNGSNAGVLWLRKPQFLNDRNLKIGLDIWSIQRIRNLFKENGEDNGAFTLKRNRLNGFIEKRWKQDQYMAGLQIDHHNDKVSQDNLGNEQIELNSINSFSPNEESSNTWFTVYGSIGRLNYKNYLIDGSQISVKASYIDTNTSDSSNHFFNIKYNYYHLFKDKRNSNFALQASANHTNLKLIQYQNYVGGLSEVRGYQDGQFFGRSAIQLNIEQRIDLFESPNFVAQGAIFSDLANTGEDIKEASEISQSTLFSSGIGLRLISPKIYRFVARLDFAQSFNIYQNKGISFGVQQFF